MCKFAKILLLAALCSFSTTPLFAPGDPVVVRAAEDKRKAEEMVTAAKKVLVDKTSVIVAAGDYVYTDAVQLVAPLADSITAPIWGACKKVDAGLKTGYLDAILDLLSTLVDNRERASQADTTALREALEANISLDDFSLVVTSPYKGDAYKQKLTDIAKAFAKQVKKKQDFKSVISIILNKLLTVDAVDKNVFAQIADMTVRRLDHDDVITTVASDGLSTDSFEFLNAEGKSYFDYSLTGTKIAKDGSKFFIFKSDLNYETSWPALRAVIEKIAGSSLYRGYTEAIDLSASLGKSVLGSNAFRSELLGRLVAPITIEEMVNCLDRMSAADTFEKNDVTRFMNRVRMTRTLLDNGQLKFTKETLRVLRQRMQFVMQSRLNVTNSEANLAAYKSEIQVLLTSLGSEAFNENIPDAGTVIALQWKNPATGLMQYFCAVQEPSRSAGAGAWELHATNTTYIDDSSLFYVVSNADRIGFQCMKGAGTEGAVGLMMQDKVEVGASGCVRFKPLTGDPATELAASVSILKASAQTQFFMEGTREAAMFKSASYVPGVAKQSGYLSVGPDGVLRTFNNGVLSPAGVWLNGALAAGPWETFSIIVVEPFLVDLAKIRNNTNEEHRLDFWKNAIKQLAADSSKDAAVRRLAVINELLLYIQSKPLRAASLTDAFAQKFSDTLDFAASMFKGQLLLEVELRTALSKARAEFEIPVDVLSDGRTPAPMPADLPLDGQSVVIFVPSLTGGSSSRYLEVVQESLDPKNPTYVIKASALDPVSDSTQFKVSVFRDFLSLESLAHPGNFFQIGLADDTYKKLAQEARVLKLRSTAKPLFKDNNGQVAGFWEDVNKVARLQLIDQTDRDGNIKDFFKCYANDAYLKVDNDGYVRTYNIANLESQVAASIKEIEPGVVPALATSFQLISVKTLYTQLGRLQKENDDLARINGYKMLVSEIETADDIQVLIDEVGGYLDGKRAEEKHWNAFDLNLALKNSFLEILKLLRSSFKNALKNKLLDNRLSDIEEKFVIPPVFSDQTLLNDGDVIALGWRDDTGITRYVSAKTVAFGNMKLTETSGVITDLSSFKDKEISQLEIGDTSPIDEATHFRVLIHPNTNVVTLQSLATQKNMQAVCFPELMDIEDRYASVDGYSSLKPAFDKYKSEVLGVGIEGELFEQEMAENRVLEEFSAVTTEGQVSFKSSATGGFVSVNPQNRRLVTLDPLTVRKAGMDKAGVLVPSPREKFSIVPVSPFVAKLGDILSESDMNARFARYLYHVTGGATDSDRKIFIDSIAQEVSNITATKESFSQYLNDANKADARSSMMAIMNQLQQDPGYQKEFKADVDRVANQLDAGYTGAGIGGVPAKGSIVVLKTCATVPKYIKVVPSQFDGSIYVLGIGADGSDDIFEPACQFMTDARSGMLGLKSAVAGNKYVKSLAIDADVAKSWISAKKNAQTELTLTGTTFGALNRFDDQLFKLVVIDAIAGTVQLQSVATGGYLSWVSGNGLPSGDVRPVQGNPRETNSTSFVSSSRARTIDPLTLKPFGKQTVNVFDASTAEDVHGTTFMLTIFDEYYKMLMSARIEKNYSARFAVYGRALPLVKSDEELRILLSELSKMVDDARSDKESPLWRDFSSEDVRSKFMALLTLVEDNFTSMLEDESHRKNSFGLLLDNLRQFESAEQVATYEARWNTLKATLNTLAADKIEDFMGDLATFTADRTDGVKVVAATTATPALLNLDFVYTVTTWLAEGAYYNKTLTQAKKRDKISALIEAARIPVSYAEYINYIDTRWVSGKDRFTANEKIYVLKHFNGMVSIPWLQLASAEDFDLSLAKDVLLRARANQLREERAAVDQVNALLPSLVYPLIDGPTYNLLIASLIKAMRSIDPSSKDFMAAKSKFIAKAGLWKTRVILTGAGQLDLYNYATTLNSLLKDPLIAQFVSIDLKPILTDLASNLNTQGIAFSIASGPEDSNIQTTISSSSGTVANSNAGASLMTSSGLSI